MSISKKNLRGLHVFLFPAVIPAVACLILASVALARTQTVSGYTDCSNGVGCVIPQKSTGTITIACVGDSITAGGWPQIMQQNLNTKYGAGVYNIINFGESGSTMQRHADSPYIMRASWSKVLNTSADVIVMMLVHFFLTCSDVPGLCDHDALVFRRLCEDRRARMIAR